jgi:hypothetical protein
MSTLPGVVNIVATNQHSAVSAVIATVAVRGIRSVT